MRFHMYNTYMHMCINVCMNVYTHLIILSKMSNLVKNNDFKNNLFCLRNKMLNKKLRTGFRKNKFLKIYEVKQSDVNLKNCPTPKF